MIPWAPPPARTRLRIDLASPSNRLCLYPTGKPNNDRPTRAQTNSDILAPNCLPPGRPPPGRTRSPDLRSALPPRPPSHAPARRPTLRGPSLVLNSYPKNGYRIASENMRRWFAKDGCASRSNYLQFVFSLFNNVILKKKSQF